MALQKQAAWLNFAQGLDTKTDPYQVDFGKFLTLNNMVFDKAKRLTKRNGFANITNLPNTEQTTLTTLNDNLIATGSNLYAFSADTDQWLNQGLVQPVNLSVQSLVRNSDSQSSVDSAVASNGLTCLTYIDNSQSYYQISDSNTGQQIVQRTSLGANVALARVYVLNRFFVIVFKQTVSVTPHLRYIAIPLSSPNSPLTVQDISTTIIANAGFDCVVANNALYIGYADSGSSIKVTQLSSTLSLASPTAINSHTATLMSLTADTSGPSAIIWVSFWDSSSTNGFTAAFAFNLAPVLVPTQIITGMSLNEITSAAENGLLTVLYEINNTYASPYPNAGVKTDYIESVTCTQAGVVGTPGVILRSVGLASKAFIASSGTIYALVAYGETNQPTYFLIDSLGNIIMRLAYANGGGYETNQILPNVSIVGTQYCVPYLIKDFLATVNKGFNSNNSQSTPLNAIYTQTGINLAKFTISTSGQHSSEIANTLHLTGGQLWMYDTVKPVEHGFHVWPENVAFTTATTGGAISAQPYFYVFTYEWTDNEGNLHRSAPSIPLKVDLTSAGTSTSVNTLYIPTLRLTYKIAPNPVRIVGYRWSQAQQIYYQFTSITSPVVNDTTIDYVTITDNAADTSIFGNTLLYTTGGVVEDIAAPASIASALFKNRLFLIDAEDPNLLWYSKQVIEGVPVEMSDLFTLFVAPTSGAQGSTGAMTAISAMDDKLIIFKKDAIYYLTGIGPDNTGNNNDFTDPIFITSSVGCNNPNSIVLMPNGLMFQSDKGIWLLGRDLSTTYIGAPVEGFNGQTVIAAASIPATNQVRFVLNNSVTLIYDYYFQQWGTFSNISAITSTLYQGFQTYLNTFGQVYQETPGTYLDGSSPVLLSFQTNWVNLAGVQGYERFYFMYLLGTYYSGFKLNVGIAYDYEDSNTQNILVTPNNSTAPWGDLATWGAPGQWGGPGNVFSPRLFPQFQKTTAFRLTVNEVYDSTITPNNGQGVALSGLNLVVGVKKGYKPKKASQSFG